MAEGLFRHAVHGRGEFRVLSAGIGAMDGQPPTPHSVLAMRELGIDISGQRSRALTAELVRQADYIFGMTHGHVDTVALLYPAAAEKTFLLREFDETLEPYEKDISDPIGSPYEVYVDCRDQIEQGIASLLKFMEQHEISAGTRRETNRRRSILRIGADHGGFELKEALKQHLLRARPDRRGFRRDDARTRRMIIRISRSRRRRPSPTAARNWACLSAPAAWAFASPPTKFPACAPAQAVDENDADADAPAQRRATSFA